MLKMSHSSMGTYSDCPLKYRFKYVDKVPEKPRHYFSFGKAIHSALEHMYRCESCPTIAEVIGAFLESWSSAGYRDESAEAKAKREGMEMLRKFHERHAPSWRKPLAVELQFDFRAGHVPVTGYIDRVDIMPDGKLRIMDYKTGRPLEEGRVLEDGQLTLYQMAVGHVFPGEQVGQLTFLHVPTLAEQDAPARTAEQEGAMLAAVTAAHQAIRRGDFPAKPCEASCQWCNFKGLCPSWRP